MKEYFIKAQNAKGSSTDSIIRGENKEDVEYQYRKKYPENVIISIELYKEYNN